MSWQQILSFQIFTENYKNSCQMNTKSIKAISKFRCEITQKGNKKDIEAHFLRCILTAYQTMAKVYSN